MKAEPTQTSRLTEIAGTLESASVLLFYLKKNYACRLWHIKETNKAINPATLAGTPSLFNLLSVPLVIILRYY